MFSLPECVECRRRAWGMQIVDGLCSVCRDKRAKASEPDAIQANYYEQGWTREARDDFARTWPRIEADIAKLAAFHRWCREHDDSR